MTARFGYLCRTAAASASTLLPYCALPAHSFDWTKVAVDCNFGKASSISTHGLPKQTDRSALSGVAVAVNAALLHLRPHLSAFFLRRGLQNPRPWLPVAPNSVLEVLEVAQVRPHSIINSTAAGSLPVSVKDPLYDESLSAGPIPGPAEAAASHKAGAPNRWPSTTKRQFRPRYPPGSLHQHTRAPFTTCTTVWGA